MPAAEMLEVEAARKEILSRVSPLPAEEVPVEEAIGRALARAVLAGRTLPPWDNSAMDGYAVRAADVAQPPARLTVIETIYAGQMPRQAVGAGQCARIMTGAPVP